MLAGALELQMSANIARLTKDIADAKGVVTSGMKGIEDAVASAKSALASLGITLGAGAFAALVKGSIDAADHLNDLSKSTSIAVEQLAGLRIAAKQSGGDLDSIAQALNKLSVNIGKDGEKFRALGITAKDPLEAFKQLADIFTQLEDPQQRAAVMAAALGKSWAGAAPLLAEGGEKIGELVKRGTEFSGMSTQFAQDSDELNDKLVLLTGTGGLLNRTVAPLLPLFNALADDMLAAQKSAQGAGESGFSPLAEALRAVIVLGGNVSFVLKGIGTDLGAMAAQLAALATGDFAAFKLIGKEVTADAAAARVAFDAWEKSMMTVGLSARAATEAVAGADNAAKAAAAARARAFLGDAKAAKDMETAYNGVIRSIKEKTAATDRELAGELKLTDGEKLKIAIDLKLADGTLKVTEAQRGNIAALVDLMLASERGLKLRQQEIEFAQSYAKILDELDAAQQREIAANAATIDGIEATNEQLTFEIAQLGQTTQAIALANVERARENALRGISSPLAIDRINELFDEQRGLVLVGDQIKAQMAIAAQLSSVWRAVGADIASNLSKAFGTAGTALGGFIKAYTDGIAAQIDLDRAYHESRDLNGQHTAEQAAQYQRATTQNALQSYGDMAGAAASYFDKQSTAYKVLHGIEQVMFAAKLAMQVAEIAGNAAKSASAMTAAEVEIATLMAVGEAEAAVAVANQAQGDPYSAWARMAAMAAAMAALGFAVAGASGSSSAASAADSQKAQGTGTVLGDANAKSASIANALAEIARTDAIGLTYSHDMLAALRSIDSAMNGLAALVYQTTGLTTGSGFDFEASVTKNRGDPIMGMLGITTPDILGPSFLGKLAQVLQGLWGKVTQSITDSGLLIAGTLGQLAAGSGVQQYANVHTDSSSFFGLVHDTSDSTLTGPLAERVNAQFALVFKNIGISIEAAAKALGLWTPSFVASMESLTLVLGKDGKISFNGLTGQDLTDAINAVFSSASDQIATAMLPGFEAFQKVGEGYYQTIIRVASQNEIVNQTLDTLGITLGATGMAAIAARMDLVDLAGGIEEFGKLTSDYYSKYFSPAEQRANLGAQLGKEFSSLGIAMPTDVGAFRALVEGIDLSTSAGRELWTTLMKIAPSFYDFADQIVGLDGKLHSTADVLAQHISLQQALDVATGAKTQREVENENRRAQAMDAASLAIINATIAQEDANAVANTTANLNTTRRSLELQMLEALGLHEQAVAQARAQAIVGLTAEQIAIYDINAGMTEFIANAKKQAEQMAERRSLEVQLMAAQGNAAGALAAQRVIDIEDMNAAQIALYDYNAALKAQIQTAKDAAAAAKEQSTLDQQLAVLRGEQTQQQVDRANAWTAALSAGARETLAAIWAEQDLAAARKTAADVAAAQAALDDRLAVATGARTQLDVTRAREWAAATTEQARATLIAIYAAEDAATAAKRWSDALHAMEQSAGVSFQTIADDIKKTLLGQMSSADLGTALADMIVGGVYNAMAAKAAQQVTDIIDQQLIEPLMAAILNGTSVTAAVNASLTQANIDTMIATATNTVTALTAVFNDPAFVKAMNDLRTMIGGVTATIQTSMTSLGQIDPGHGPARAGLPGEIWIDTGGGYGYWTQDPNYTSPGGTTTSNAAQILNDRLSLLAEIYKLTGDAAGAAAVLEQQHAIALAAMDPSLRELQTQLWGLQKAAEAAARATALNDWLKSNAMSSTLSPLTAQQQLAEAQRQYADELRLAKGGDTKALGDITQYADALLAAEKAVTGFGGGYSALYAAIRADIGGLAASNGMTAGESAIAGNVVQLHTDVTDQTAILGRLLERLLEATTEQTAAVAGAVTTSAAKQTSATTAALVVNARN